MKVENHPSPCTIENGNVKFCPAMNQYCQGVNERAKGLVALQLCDLKKGTIRIAGVVYKDKPSSSGILLNSCPWCGHELNAVAEDK